ncbi:hypothetical protein BRADI_4g11253v3 [Brachypodium distachyon]|uniref:DUF4283 domain-containing protein n=1 Tax=Brachypodium distachyon TaxID=15368 RepID=A0A0Q3PDY6_BRADI|nr:hypothetical protein BRADI_4g11253v3 [Brachypodium distachyon]
MGILLGWSILGSGGASAATYFNCRKTGHFQASCPFPASCISCKKDGHATVLCPTKGKKAELSLLGFGIPGQGFYHLKLATSGDDEKASNSVLVSVQTTQISSQLLEDELKNLFEEEWDWQVKQLSDLEFIVVFPSKESLRFACKSGRLVLSLNQVSVSIKEEEVDAEASSILSEVWLKLSGIPRKIRDPEILVVAFQMLGKAIEVDGSSLTRKGLVQMKFQCRNPNKIRGSVEIFIHKIGYKIKVVPEMPTGASKPPPVPPSEDSHGDDSADPTIDEEEWERLGKHDKERKDTAASQNAPAKLPSVVIDQYGSNLRGAGDIFPVLRLLQAPPLPASALVPGMAPPLSAALMEISDDDQQPIPTTDGSPFRLLSLSPLAREKGGLGQRDWDFADIAVLPTDLQSPPAVAEVPEVPLTLTRDLLEELPSSTPFCRAKRSTATPVVATRKSVRNASASAIPVLQHAALMQAEKNLEAPGKFQLLSKFSDDHLLKVASDSCVVFDSSVGPPSVHLSAIRAKELAQAAFAEAAARAAAKPETPPEPPAPTSSSPSKPAPPTPKAGRSKKLASGTLALRKGRAVLLRAK